MTLLTICQDAAAEIGIEPPGVVVGNTDANVRRLLRAANRAGADIATAADWMALRRRASFVAVAGEAQSAALPADFARMAPDTLWDRTNARLISGPLSAERWQFVQSLGAAGAVFTLRNGLVIYPGMTGGEALDFEYYTTGFAQSSDGLTGRSRWAADADTARVSEELFTLGVVAFFLLGVALPTAGAAEGAYRERLSREAMSDRADAMTLSAGDIFGQRRGDGAGVVAW